MWRARRALTLVEVLIAATVATLILGILYRFLVPVMEGSKRGAEAVEAQQTAATTMSRVVTALHHTSPDSLFIEDGWLAFRTAQDTTPEGKTVWSERLTVFHLSDGRLEQAEYPLSGAEPTAAGFQISSDELAGNLQSQRLLATGVEVFEVSIGPPLEVRLVLLREGYGTREDSRLELRRVVNLRL